MPLVRCGISRSSRRGRKSLFERLVSASLKGRSRLMGFLAESRRLASRWRGDGSREGDPGIRAGRSRHRIPLPCRNRARRRTEREAPPRDFPQGCRHASRDPAHCVVFEDAHVRDSRRGHAPDMKAVALATSLAASELQTHRRCSGIVRDYTSLEPPGYRGAATAAVMAANGFLVRILFPLPDEGFLERNNAERVMP